MGLVPSHGKLLHACSKEPSGFTTYAILPKSITRTPYRNSSGTFFLFRNKPRERSIFFLGTDPIKEGEKNQMPIDYSKWGRLDANSDDETDDEEQEYDDDDDDLQTTIVERRRSTWGKLEKIPSVPLGSFPAPSSACFAASLGSKAPFAPALVLIRRELSSNLVVSIRKLPNQGDFVEKNPRFSTDQLARE